MKNSLLCLILVLFNLNVFSQNSENAKPVNNFRTTITLTSKGISTIPNLTLGKPAALFDMSMGRRLTFDPSFRFSLEGKPWSILFWGRYKLITKEKFQMSIGAHPALSFKAVNDTAYGEKIETRRYLAGELSPNYSVTNGIGFGVYYLYSRGVDKGTTKNTHMIALRTNFSNIRLSEQFFIRFNPQVYYLNMDKKDGYYFNSTLMLARRNFPLSISALINRTIHTNINGGEDFLWNISLIYTFNKQYIEK